MLLVGRTQYSTSPCNSTLAWCDAIAKSGVGQRCSACLYGRLQQLFGFAMLGMDLSLAIFHVSVSCLICHICASIRHRSGIRLEGPAPAHIQYCPQVMTDMETSVRGNGEVASLLLLRHLPTIGGWPLCLPYPIAWVVGRSHMKTEERRHSPYVHSAVLRHSSGCPADSATMSTTRVQVLRPRYDTFLLCPHREGARAHQH